MCELSFPLGYFESFSNLSQDLVALINENPLTGLKNSPYKKSRYRIDVFSSIGVL